MDTTSDINKGLHYRILQNIPVAILLIDQNYDFLFANSLFRNLTGLSLSQTSGTDWTDFIASDKRQHLFQVLSELKNQTFSSKKLSIQLTSKPDSRTSLMITSEQDDKLGWLYSLTFLPSETKIIVPEIDILDLKSNESDLNQHTDRTREISLIGKNDEATEVKLADRQALSEKYIAELKASNRLKDKILAIISHDMSAPIASLKGLTSSLLDEELSEKERALVRESLLKQLDSVSELTENLLRWATNSFTKQGPGKTEPIKLLDVVDRNVQLIAPQAFTKKIKITSKIPAGLFVRANKDQLHIVIRNIITNSMKYTPANGEIDISGNALKSIVQIRVKDTGIGITSEQLATLFTYTQNSTYGTNGEKGIGLGLMLCKEYVEANGGKISVSSIVHSGTTVLIELPAD
ncbi:sensor histidine kinase [Dyadobacter psychrotolerans]|nr:PAS domain-containing sensor histidine kinase [Dyadobacter psychrotolerans]